MKPRRRRIAALFAALGVLGACSSTSSQEAVAPDTRLIGDERPSLQVEVIGFPTTTAPVEETTTTTTTTVETTTTTFVPTTLEPITVPQLAPVIPTPPAPQPTAPPAPQPTAPPVTVTVTVLVPVPVPAPAPKPVPLAPAPTTQRTTKPKPVRATPAPPTPTPQAPPPTTVAAPPVTAEATASTTTPPVTSAAIATPTVPPAPAPEPTALPTVPPVASTIAPNPTNPTKPTKRTKPTTTKKPKPTTTKPLTPKVNVACKKAQRSTTVTRADGSLVTCLQNPKKLWVWTLQASTTTAAGAATAPTATPIPTPTAGFDGKTIRVGVLTTTTNPVWGPIGKALNAGMDARVAAINKAGGIAGKYKIELVKSETDYDPNQTAAQLNATQANVVGYMSVLGTPNVEAIEPTLRSLNIVAGAASQEARWSKFPNLIPVFNSYQVHAINGISYFLDVTARPQATVCGLSVATSYGAAGTEGIKFAATKRPFTLGPVLQIGPTDTNVAPAIDGFRAANCEAVVLTTTPQQTAAIVLGAFRAGYTPRWLVMGASFSERILSTQTSPVFEKTVWVLGDGAQFSESAAPGIAQLKADLIASNNKVWVENPDTGLTFGWTQAKVFEALLTRAVARGDLSHAGLLAAAKELGVVDTQGVGSAVNYSAPLRVGDGRTQILAIDVSFKGATRVLDPNIRTSEAKAYAPA